MKSKSFFRRSATLPAPVCMVLALFLVGISAAPATADAQTWQPLGPPLAIAGLAVGAGQLLPATPGVIYASVTGVEGVFSSADGGISWRDSGAVFIPPFGGGSENVNLLVADPQTPGTAYAVNGGALFKTTDGGVSWQGTFGTSGGNALCGVTHLAVAPSRPSQLYAIGAPFDLDPAPPCFDPDGGIAVSSDGGATFSLAANAAAPFTALAVDPADPNRIYVASPSRLLIYTSDDGGKTLTALPPLPAAGEQVVNLAVDASTTPSTLLAVVNIADPFEEAIYRSQPGAATGSSPFWTSPEAGLPMGLQVTGLAVQPGILGIPAAVYASSDLGVFLSQDHGNTWTQENDGLPSPKVSVLALDPSFGTLYAGTSSGLAVFNPIGCQKGGTSACLDGSRFTVQVTYQLDGQSTAAAQAVQLSDDTTAFWFFDAASYELMVKVLDGRSVNGAFWVFSGGLSNVEYTITVTDTLTGEVKTYPKGAGILASFADTNAFPPVVTPGLAPAAIPGTAGKAGRAEGTATGKSAAAPTGTAGTCTADATDLCLLVPRFQVKVAWNGGSLSGNGQAIQLTNDTGSFWFLDADNFELTVKVIDGSAVNGHFWVFYGDMTNFEFTLTVTDTTNGAVKTYVNPAGTITSVADTSAF
jgi:hypothetical protein